MWVCRLVVSNKQNFRHCHCFTKDHSVSRHYPWNGAEGGRLQSIVRHSTRKHKRMVMKLFENFEALNGVVGEIVSTVTVGACAGPMPLLQPIVILRGYKDTIYIALVGISPCFVAPLMFIIERMTTIIYGKPLKWERHGDVTTWGEACVILAPRSICMTLQCIEKVLYTSSMRGDTVQWMQSGSSGSVSTLRLHVRS